MSTYRRRILDDELDELMGSLAAVAIEGPKAAGKTTTALKRGATIFRLDDPAVAEAISAEPGLLTSSAPPIVLDEWQRLPTVWDLVRRAVDDGAEPGTFLLTGSASPTELPTHSGAGRIAQLRMHPLSLAERDVETPTVSVHQLLNHPGENEVHGTTDMGLTRYVEEILCSGFPGIRGLPGRPLRTQLDGYLARIADRDFAEQGLVVRRPATLTAWMRAYAAATSGTASFDAIRRAASPDGAVPARSTSQPWRDILEQLWIVDPVPAWTTTNNALRRLTQAPKHQLADPALAARLIRVTADQLLTGVNPGPSIPRQGSLLGALFESLVTQSLRVYAQASEAAVRHLRTRDGDHEVDLILERDDGAVIGFEVKVARTVDSDDTKHLRWLRDQIGERFIDGVVVTTGQYAYRRDDGIAVVPLALLGP